MSTVANFFSSIPLPWRKYTPLHHKLGARSIRYNYSVIQGTPTIAAPGSLNFRYDASASMDRIIGFCLSIQSVVNSGTFILADLNTGWQFSTAYSAGSPTYIMGNIETLPDEAHLIWSFSAAPGSQVYLSFLNNEVVPLEAGSGGGGASGNVYVTGGAVISLAYEGTFTDFSGLIATGGTSQVAAPANATRKGLIVANRSTATGQQIGAAESLFLNFGVAAGVNAVDGSIEVPTGQSWFFPATMVCVQSVNINAATTGHLYNVKELN